MIWNINDWEFLNNTGIGEYIKNHIVIVSIIIVLLAIFIYAIIAVFLNKLNKSKYGKTTWMAWIPGIRIFLLGKLTIHTIFGIILALGIILCFSIKLTNNGIQEVYEILPSNVRTPYTIIYLIVIVVLFIYAFIKQRALERKVGDNNNSIVNRSFVSAYDEKFGKNNSLNNANKTLQNNTNNYSYSAKEEENNFYKSSDNAIKESEPVVYNKTESPLADLTNNVTNNSNNP